MADDGFERLDMSEIGQTSVAATDLFAACEGGQLQVVESILKSNDELSANVTGPNGDTPLHVAARSGHLAVVTYLKENGAELNKRNEAGETAVHVATRQGFVHVVEYLHLSGADVNIKTARGSTALHIACQKRNTSIALVLLHLGCKLDITDQMDEMALHDACREEILTVVQAMCSYGCPVDLENKAGLSPLHLAAKVGNTDIVRCLLLSGADIDRSNKDGVRAEDIALAQGHNDVADLLSRLSASITEDKRDSYVRELLPTNVMIDNMKIKVFGSGGVGKTTLIDSLKCGYIRSLIRRVYSGYTSPVPAKEPYAIKKSRKKRLQVPFESYTKGIVVEQASLSDAGDVSIWEFSGYEPYYGLYDFFIGDPNCLHMVVISMKDPEEIRKAQLDFWLSFIRARIAPVEPFGYAGNQLWAPHVLLVATHADVGFGCFRNAKGELVMENESKIMEEVEKVFHADLILSRRVILVDAHQAMSAEMKNLRFTIAKSKELICQYLPPSIGFLQKAIAELPNWNKMLPGFPVVSWSSFVEYVRTRVNLLATEEHLKELAYQLQVVGEIVYLETPGEDLVVISPHWLGTEIIGKLMSYEHVATAPENGRLRMEDLRLLFPKLDAADIIRLMEALHVCIQCSDAGDIEYDFPFLNVLESPSALWTAGETEDAVHGGIRIFSPPEFGDQFFHVFPRVVVGLRTALQTNANYVCSEWSTRFKVQLDGMAAAVSLVRRGKALDVECRGSKSKRSDLFDLQQRLFAIIIGVFNHCCPGIYLEQNPISPTHLQLGKPTPHIYSPRDILVAQMEGKSDLRLDNSTSEKLRDVLAFGSDEIYSSLTPGIDLHVSYVSIYSRCQLAALLDPTFQTEAEQDKFALMLGIADQLKSHSSPETSQFSNSDKMLALWSLNPTSTIRLLCQKFNEYERPYAANLLISLSPLYQCSAQNHLAPATSS